MSPFTGPALSRALVGQKPSTLWFHFWATRRTGPVTSCCVVRLYHYWSDGLSRPPLFSELSLLGLRITSPISTSQWAGRVFYGPHHKVAQSWLGRLRLIIVGYVRYGLHFLGFSPYVIMGYPYIDRCQLVVGPEMPFSRAMRAPRGRLGPHVVPRVQSQLVG